MRWVIPDLVHDAAPIVTGSPNLGFPVLSVRLTPMLGVIRPVPVSVSASKVDQSVVQRCCSIRHNCRSML